MGSGISWLSDGMHLILKHHSSQPQSPVLITDVMAKFYYQVIFPDV